MALAQLRQHVDYVDDHQVSPTSDGKTATMKLIYYGQELEVTAIDCPILHKVVAPDMVRVLGLVGELCRLPQHPLFAELGRNL